MRPIILKLFLLVICIGLNQHTHAQICTGSLGDPVFKVDFSAGQNPGGALQGGITNLTYTANNCPDDGFYTISNSLVSPGNCHTTWHDIPHDHTGDLNGYMMIINASNTPNVFFTQPVFGLCPNTTYEFSAYILNLIKLSVSGPAVSEPNITFSIQTTTGRILATSNTGTIAPTDSAQWNQYGTYFTTPANITDVVVVMTNNAPGGNGNDLILDDITFRACGPIVQTGFSSATGPLNQDLCEHGAAHYTIKASVVGGDSNLLFQWQENKLVSGWVDMAAPAGQIPDSLNIDFLNAVPGKYQYRLGIISSSNPSSINCRVYSLPLTINVNPIPIVPSIPSQIICQGNTLQLTASGGESYIWTGPNMQPASQNPLIINNVTTANTGTYSVVASNKTCAAPAVQVAVTVVPKVTASVNVNTFNICAGQSVQLSASGGPHYKWKPSAGLNNDTIPNPVASPLQTTMYTVDVSNGGCDDSTKSVTVTVNQNPVANAGGDKTLFYGQSVKLNASITGDNITSYYWTPATFLDDPSSLTPTATPLGDITYTLTAVSKTCGISTSKAFVRVFKKITVPNTFSPNSDGINDKWNINALATYPQSSVMIYNRYGQQVYQSTGYSEPWDGTYNGAPLPQGTYYYIIDLKNEQPKIAGWVAIIR